MSIGSALFGRPFVKRFALCYRTTVLSVCNVGALWPNGLTDQDETWLAGRPRPWPHCVRWAPTKGGGVPNFWLISVVTKWLDGSRCHLAGRYRPQPKRHCVRWGPSSPPQRGTAPNFQPMSIMAKRMDVSRCHFVRRWASAQATLC